MRMALQVFCACTLVACGAGIVCSELAPAKKTTQPGYCLENSEDFCDVGFNDRCTKKLGTPLVTAWYEADQGNRI